MNQNNEQEAQEFVTKYVYFKKNYNGVIYMQTLHSNNLDQAPRGERIYELKVRIPVAWEKREPEVEGTISGELSVVAEPCDG